jgi:hypothetical protein
MKLKLSFVALVAGLSAAALAAPPKRTSAPSTRGAVPKPDTAPPRLYDFKGIPLEISLADFKVRPHPDGTDATVLCTGDKFANYSGILEEPFMVRIYDDVEKSLGVKRCYYNERGKGANYAASMTLAASGYSLKDYGFYFIKDPNDGVEKLFRFDGTAHHNVASDVLQALTSKFGAPKIVLNKVQNKMGASFDHTTAVWSNPLAEFEFEDRYTTIDDMGILMMDKRLSAIVSLAKAAKKAATPNAI